jgi:hypothetical protein
MRGLERIPSESQLASAYGRLQAPQFRDVPVSVEDWALWSQWSRLDPRLAEIWCARMALDWRQVAPFALNAALRSLPWGAAAGVLFLQTKTQLPASSRKTFASWCHIVMDGIAPAAGEAFFIGQRAFAGRLMQEDARLSLGSYLKWGYFGREVLVNKAASRRNAATQLSAEKRRGLLEELIRDCGRTGRSITVRDYLDALGPGVSRRVAELDLQACPLLRSRGRGRGKLYLPKTAGGPA